MKTPYDRLAKINTNCTGHMTKMATTPIYGKNPLNVFFSGTLVCSIGDVGPTRFAQMINLGWPWPTLWQGQIWFLMHLFGKNLVWSTKCQADLWPFIQGHSFGLPHTDLGSTVAQWLSAWLETEGPRVRASPASLCCGPWARHIYPSLLLVQPRKTRPDITERLLMGCKE